MPPPPEGMLIDFKEATPADSYIGEKLREELKTDNGVTPYLLRNKTKSNITISKVANLFLFIQEIIDNNVAEIINKFN